MTRILKVDPDSPEEEAIREASSVIRRGGLVAFPTETVYGLGADSFNPSAVERIFRAKGRPPDNPLIVHIASAGDLDLVAADPPEEAYRVAERAWPGPLTIILKRRPGLPGVVSAGLPTVAVRMPAHRVALRLIEEAGTPIAAPSANLSGRPSPTRAEHVVRDLSGRVDLVLDGGETFFGVESTIIDVTRRPPVLLRPGPITLSQLREILGTEVLVAPEARGELWSERPLAPGMKYKHYSPQTELLLVEAGDYRDLGSYTKRVRGVVREARSRGYRVAVIASEETAEEYRGVADSVLVIGPRSDLLVVARRLFTTLRKVDEVGVDLCVVEGFPEEGIGLAIMNRLRKASARIVKT